jgi:hypothetical protein
MRILHAPVNVGNHPWVLSRQERALGAKSDLVVSYGTWLNYPADRFLSAEPTPNWGPLLKRAWFGLSSTFRYDVFHYYFGRSFLAWDTGRKLPGRFLDLKLARWLGRKVFMTLQGCDVRNSDRNSERNEITMCHLGHCKFAENCRANEDPKRRDLVRRILPYCHRVFVLNPDLCNDVPGASFLPYANVDVEPVEPVWPRTDGPIRLLHAPTDEAVKGTPFILAAIDRLKQRWPIELTLVRGLPHAEALKLYRQADLVIDQLLAGWYGGFAVETMALGKPVACYIREADLVHIPAAMRTDLAPLRISLPTLEADLEGLFRRRQEWPEWGRRARRYVLRWHHPRRIAEAMLRAYKDPQSTFDMTVATGGHARCAA